MIHTHELKRIFGSRFRRKKITAVNNVSLDIKAGELFGLVGPDGAGKTTVLRMLAGILEPTSGKAVIDGHDSIAGAESIKPILGYMPQQFGLYPDLTVDENLAFISDAFNVTGIYREKRIQELLDFTNLHKFRQRRSKHLSGGMQKKLGLTAALIHQPRLLILDEPTTGVDPVARRELWDILTELHAKGSTIVVSTPYMDEAERCNRVGLMYNGEMMVCDTPRAIKRMLPGVVYALRANDLFQAEKILSAAEGVLDVQPYGDLLNIIATDKSQHASIEHTLIHSGIKIYSLCLTTPRLEEAFIYFVRQYNQTKVQEIRTV